MSVVAVKVIPKSGRSQLKFEGDLLKVWLKSVPEDGKANDELVRKLAKIFHLSKSSIEITRGKTSKNKRVHISGISLEGMKKTLG